MCGIPLYAEDALYEADEAYMINDHVICEDCVTEYVKKNCKHELVWHQPDDAGSHKELYYEVESISKSKTNKQNGDGE